MIREKQINRNNKERGQVALVVLIVSAVVLTLGLSTSKRSVTENKITTEEGLMKEAFNVAESGIDYYLGTGNKEYTVNNGGSQSTAYVNTKDITSDGLFVMEYGEETLRNNIVNFWLVAHNSNDNTIEWNNASNYDGGQDIDVCVNNSFNGGLVVNYFYADTPARTNYGVKRMAFYMGDGSSYQNFSAASGGNDSCGAGRVRVGTIAAELNSVPILITIKPLGASARIAIQTDSAIPVQGEEISSTAIVGDQETGVRKTIKVLRRFEVPQFMLDAITAEGDIRAN